MFFTITKNQIVLIIICIIIVLTVFFLIWQDNDIVSTKITYSNQNIPSSFKGLKIVHLSDLHNKNFGDKQSTLVKKISECEPDIIVITGDLIDKHRTNVDVAINLIQKIAKIAPCYYVPGNHESVSFEYSELREKLILCQVNVLENKKLTISKGNQSIDIIGLKDIGFYNPNQLNQSKEKLSQNLKNLTKDSNNFKILISHRPDLIDYYSKEKVDLVFSGHAHGGQIRLPFIGGLLAPGQGFFPKYTSGSYTQGDTTLVVSRGLGNSLFPFRIFNRPEIIQLTLK